MSSVADTGVTVSERGDLLIVALRPPAGPGDPVGAWMVNAVAALIAEVRQHADTMARPGRIALVLEAPAVTGQDERAAAQGLAHAVRGIAQSIALELAPGTRVNAVLCDASGAPDDALALLAGADGGFITGSTIDLRRSS
jgi:hypothetical protein